VAGDQEARHRPIAGDRLGDPQDIWPPLVYWPKLELPCHPREARGRRTMLLWRSGAGSPATQLVPLLDPLLKPVASEAAALLMANAAIEQGPCSCPAHAGLEAISLGT
jgi:hypothetical protein